MTKICSQAPIAASSILSSVERGNVAPSPVPWISTNVPVSVATTFMSTSARESSEYGRSTRMRPSTTPTLTAAIAHDSGRGSDSRPAAAKYVTASVRPTYPPVIAAVRVPPAAVRRQAGRLLVWTRANPNRWVRRQSGASDVERLVAHHGVHGSVELGLRFADDILA